MDNIKVYKMNEYEWWASKLDESETLGFYLKEMQVDEEYNPLEDIVECDIDKEGMWWKTEDMADLENLRDNDEMIHYETINGIKVKKVKVGDLMKIYGEVHKFISLREAIQRNGEYKEPYMIATTEW